jgi:hypothetical protein
MSEERRKKQAVRQGQGSSNGGPLRYVVVAVAIVAIFAAGYFFAHKRNAHMDAFAKCLTGKQAKMYGAFWCQHCQDQKEKFGASFEFAPYIECGIKGSQAIAAVCTGAGIKRFPTWIFSDGTRVEGAHELDFLGEKTGCPLP